MQIFNYPQKNNQRILALGAESNGNFSVFSNNKLYFSQDFGDLLEEENFNKFKKKLRGFLNKNKLKPSIVLTDLHPLYKTTTLGKDLAKKYQAEHIQIQHHLAHIFSALGEKTLQTKNYQLPTEFYGIALDGTGYGLDGKIWGGECFAISNFQFPISNKFSNSNDKISKQKKKIERIGHLENQVMIGGELAVREPARMLIGILSKFLSKGKIYTQVKKYYSAQEFEVLYNQLQQKFNCIETSSTGRVSDAVSILLGFCTNKRNYKHEPIELLEKNSSKPYQDLEPKVLEIKNSTLEIDSKFKIQNSKLILDTTYLFEYLIKNFHKDKQRLAATAQLYIAEGLYKLACNSGLKPESSHKASILDPRFHGNDIFLAGGIANNKIISAYFESKKNKAGVPSGKPAVQIPRGDAGLSFGQIIFYLANPRD